MGTAATDDAPRELLAGRYRLGSLIARGGMGDVYRARDQNLDRDVAVKFLRPELATDEEARARFETEARAAARLNHPNVVTVFDTGEAGDRVYIVMECLSGRTLADEMAGGPLGPARVREVARSVLRALDAAHREHLLHRDIKPSNILVTRDGSVKVTDFGIAKSTREPGHTATGVLMGTPAYVAPERLDNLPASPQSDLYAVGVLMYEALAGRPPFDADTPLAMVKAITSSRPEPLDALVAGVDPALAVVVDTALEKEPLHRYGSAAEMLVALDAGTATGATQQLEVETGDGREAALTAPLATVSVGAAPTGRMDGRGDPPTKVMPVGERPAQVPRRTAPGRLPRRAVVIGLLVVVLVMLFAIGMNRGDSRLSPGAEPLAEQPEQPASSESDLPAPLDEALIELEEAVR